MRAQPAFHLRTPKITEAQIAAACNELLLADGWRGVVTDPPQLRGLGVSEKGIPDGLYIRYDDPRVDAVIKRGKGEGTFWQRIQAQVLWIEWKRKGGKAAQHQRDWHAAERARGALVLLAGEDFPATIDGFTDFYFNSGLNRKLRR